MKQLTSYPLTTNTEINSLSEMMMCKLLIHNTIKENESRNTKQFSSYPLTTNTEVNLPAIFMMCELLIHGITKK